MNLALIQKRILDLGKKRIKFIILFGSNSIGKATPLSDLDLAVYYEGDAKERFKFRVKALGELPAKIDLQIFQDLPLTVQKEVIKGKILFYEDYDLIFEEFMKVIKEYNSFEKYYLEYINHLKEEVEVSN